MRSLTVDLTADRTLFFMHIPKTAGTTFLSILERMFGPIYRPVTWERGETEEHLRFDPASVRGKRVFAGHWNFSVVERAPWLVPITVLREPIERFISHFKYTRRMNAPTTRILHERIHEQGLDLDAFLDDRDVKQWLWNFQTRQVAGYLWREAPTPPPDELLDIAKANLDCCVYVGLTERMAESVLLLATIFGQAPITEIETLNADAEKTDGATLAASTREKIVALSSLDVALYEYAKQRYNDDLTTMLRHLFAGSWDEAPTGIPTLAPSPGATIYAKRLFDPVVFTLAAEKALAFHTQRRGVLVP
jgi:hypothetical protein